MGIDYQAAVMIGLPRGEVELENLEDLIDEDEITVCPPYYDGSGEDCAIVGFMYKRSGSYTPKEFEWDQAQIDRLKADFKALTNQDARVWLTPRGQ